MKRRWQLQEAKNRLSEVITQALEQGPQTITRRGVEVAVVVSVAEYNRLTTPRTSLVDFFRSSPLCETDLDTSRQKGPLREVTL